MLAPKTSPRMSGTTRVIIAARNQNRAQNVS